MEPNQKISCAECEFVLTVSNLVERYEENIADTFWKVPFTYHAVVGGKGKIVNDYLLKKVVLNAGGWDRLLCNCGKIVGVRIFTGNRQIKDLIGHDLLFGVEVSKE
jgi:hypothetical protein